jgi:hypothetical protein
MHEDDTPAPRSLRRLLRDVPALHGTRTEALMPPVLAYITATVRPTDRTIETGAGHSTIAFARAGAEHTCIVPAATEIEAIRRFCATHGVGLGRVVFHVSRSEDVLPRLDLGPLDFALIDGSHSFPQVFIDWFYLARPLRVGGTLIVDDTQLWTGRVLREFLSAEPGWRLRATFAGRTAIFSKTADADPGRNWTEQPYVARRGRLRRSVATARELALRARALGPLRP